MKRVIILFFFFCIGNFLFSQSTVTLTIQNANCTSSTGIITINSVSVSATPNYSVSEGAATIGTNVTLPFTFTNVSVGIHTYVVTGSNSVAITFTANIQSNTTQPLIFANVGGTITCSSPITVLTGTSNVSNATYSWSPQNVTTNTALAIGGGNYTLTITDPANNCPNTTVVTVFQNTSAPSITAVANSSITCTNSLVVITGTSSTGGVTYSWAPTGSTSTSISTTGVGIHTLTITDPSNGCKAVRSVTVYQIGQFSASVTLLNNVKCNGASTGEVELDLIGGSGIYSVTILNSNFFVGNLTTFPTAITGLAAGNNSIAILDTLSGCTQTLFITLTQPPALNLLITLTSQLIICEGEPVTMYATLTGGVRPYKYQWLPVGGTDSTLSEIAGANSYTLIATDANSCTTMSVKNVTVNLKPQFVLLNPTAIICGSICVNFSLSAAQNTTYVYNWNFTDINGNATPIQVNQYNPSICFTQVGKYNCDVSVITPQGCSTQSIIPTFLKLYPKVRSAFTYDPGSGIYIFDEVQFINYSTGADWFNWYAENTHFSDQIHPSYNFYEPGTVLMSLIASNEGCSDTISKYITIGEATFMHFPNAFTPNGDDLNDVWRPVCYGDYQGGEYELSIFDRWGKRVFWTIVIDSGWDGTFKDKPCEDGVYNWRVKVKTKTLNNEKLRGIINLKR